MAATAWERARGVWIWRGRVMVLGTIVAIASFMPGLAWAKGPIVSGPLASVAKAWALGLVRLWG